MINILFIAQRWSEYNEYKQLYWLSDVYHMFYSSFNSTGLGHYKVFEWDSKLNINSDLDKSLVDLCKYNKFDVIIFIEYVERFYKFTDNTWNYIKNELNIPIVYCYTDTYPERDNHSHNIHADLIVSVDTDRHINKNLEKGIFAYCYTVPQDPGLYFNLELVRDIPIVFAGSIVRLERQDLLKYLNSVGIPIFIRGGKHKVLNEGGKIASPLEYAIDYMRSKLSICLNHNYEDYTIQGHVYESMFCGCCTFISKSKRVETLFKKGVHYVEFTDKYDLADKLIYYLDNEDEATEIAKNGHIEIQKYNAYNFYNTMFINLDKVCNKFNYKGH